MKEYLFERGKKVYKLTEDGILYSKRKVNTTKGVNRYKKVKIPKVNSHQIVIGYDRYNRKKFYYELYHNTKLKEGETVRFRNKIGDYSKSNLLLKTISENDPSYFRDINKKIYHYNYKNVLIGIYNSQYEASLKTGIKQTYISKYLLGKVKKIRLKDYSYMIYEGGELLDRYSDYNQRGINTVIQMDLDGNELNRFGNAKDAAEILELGTCAESHIVKCCRKKREKAYGYKWSYPYYDKKRLIKMVVKYNKNGKPISVYENRQDAIKNIPISKSYLSVLISGKTIHKKFNIKEVSYDVGINIKNKIAVEI